MLSPPKCPVVFKVAAVLFFNASPPNAAPTFSNFFFLVSGISLLKQIQEMYPRNCSL